MLIDEESFSKGALERRRFKQVSYHDYELNANKKQINVLYKLSKGYIKRKRK